MTSAEWEGLLNSRIIAAYSAGLSVVEITRTLGKLQVDFVHNLLRETGAIPAMARCDYRRTYRIDGRLAEALRNMGYSFGRWCLGWRLDPDTATADLGTAPEEGRPSVVHEALRRDYPVIYFRLFGGGRPPRRSRWAGTAAHPSLIIDWDHDHAKYVARVPDYAEVEGIGHDWTEAVEEAKIAYRYQMSIHRLNLALTDRKIA